MGEDRNRVRVRCKDCTFERVVTADDDEKPADVVVEHGRRTGHTLSISRIEDDEG